MDSKLVEFALTKLREVHGILGDIPPERTEFTSVEVNRYPALGQESTNIKFTLDGVTLEIRLENRSRSK